MHGTLSEAPTASMPAIVGSASHYGAFVKLCRLRVEQLGITFETVDEICGFPARYTAHLLAGDKAMSIYSLFVLARGLALLPMFGHDDTELDRLKQRQNWILSRRKGARWRRKQTNKKHRLGPDFRKIRSMRANLIRTQKVSPRRRSKIARNAALARWQRAQSQTANNGTTAPSVSHGGAV